MYIKVKVTANSRNEDIKKEKEDSYRIAVREKAENNRANERVLEIIKEQFPGTTVRLVSGHHSPGKILSVDPA